MKKIKFTEPYISGLEIAYINKIFKKNNFGNEGVYSKKSALLIKKHLKCKSVLLTSSCTAAIEIALISLNLRPDEEVIVPSYTFVSVPDILVKLKIKIVFCDIDDHFTLSLEDLSNKITKNTRAIILTHNNGNSVNFDELKKIIKKKNIIVIEDAAQSYGAKYKNSYLGTLGDFGCISFHHTKNVHCGIGGALLINNKNFEKISNIIWNRGTNRSDFLKGNVKKYVWISQGNSSHLSEIQAAFLYAQLLNFKKVLNYRKFIYNEYLKLLEVIKNKITLPAINKFNKSNYHLFYILIPKKFLRINFIKFMKKKNIQVTSHYEALHSSPMVLNNLKLKFKLPISDDLSKRIIRFPMHTNLIKKDIQKICKYTKIFFNKNVN